MRRYIGWSERSKESVDLELRFSDYNVRAGTGNGLVAVGDGVADDTAVVAAILAAAPAGSRIFWPSLNAAGLPAVYLVDTAVLNKVNLTFIGYGATIKKKASTITHLFIDHAAAADNFSAYGLTFDMNLASGFATYGQSNSPFSFNRTRYLKFVDCVFQNGVEEGIRMQKCQYVEVLHCRFKSLTDNGVEFFATDGGDGYFTGTRPNQDASFLKVTGSHFEDIKDGYYGAVNGCAVVIGGGVRVVTDVDVSHNTILRCSRGLWSETNHATNALRRIHFNDNILHEIEYAGIGLVSCRDSSICRNTITDLGIWTAGDAAPPDPTALGYSPISDNGGLFSSGSVTNPTQDSKIEDNILVESRTAGAQKWMYGVRIAVGTRVSVKRNIIVGMKTKDYVSVGWHNFTGSVVPSPIPHVNVRHSASQTLTTGVTLSPVLFDTERYDTALMHDTVTNNGRLTCRTPGRYRVTLNLSFLSNATGYRQLRLFKNGGTVVGEWTSNAVNGEDTSLGGSIEIDLRAEDTPLGTVADYLTVSGFQNCGGDLALLTSVERALFSAVLIDGSA